MDGHIVEILSQKKGQERYFLILNGRAKVLPTKAEEGLRVLLQERSKKSKEAMFVIS
jgi:hypothetical protein